MKIGEILLERRNPGDTEMPHHEVLQRDARMCN